LQLLKNSKTRPAIQPGELVNCTEWIRHTVTDEAVRQDSTVQSQTWHQHCL